MTPSSGRRRRRQLQFPLQRPRENGTAESMGQLVKVEVQPGEALRFPQQCVNCGREPVDSMRLQKRRGRVTRQIDVPLCADCVQELQRLSGDEERWLRMGWFFGAVSFLLGLVLFLLFLPGWLAFWPRLLMAAIIAGAAAAAVTLYIRRRSLEKARPEKIAVRNSARLADFSWRATTFEFEDEEFAGEFIELNKEKLLERREL